MNKEIYDPPLDAGIRHQVDVLRAHGVDTYESCEGGASHAYPVPTVRFHGHQSEGYRAFAIALDHDLDVREVRRVWQVLDGELVGPKWEMTFSPQTVK